MISRFALVALAPAFAACTVAPPTEGARGQTVPDAEMCVPQVVFEGLFDVQHPDVVLPDAAPTRIEIGGGRITIEQAGGTVLESEVRSVALEGDLLMLLELRNTVAVGHGGPDTTVSWLTFRLDDFDHDRQAWEVTDLSRRILAESPIFAVERLAQPPVEWCPFGEGWVTAGSQVPVPSLGCEMVPLERSDLPVFCEDVSGCDDDDDCLVVNADPCCDGFAQIAVLADRAQAVMNRLGTCEPGTTCMACEPLQGRAACDINGMCGINVGGLQ
jgi:hypothetical protein